jgi:hypothetical protein
MRGITVLIPGEKTYAYTTVYLPSYLKKVGLMSMFVGEQSFHSYGTYEGNLCMRAAQP